MSSRPLVALVGRPNVGKSTIFNRMTRSRRALVYDQPGVTRDRLFGDVRVDNLAFTVIDTGGLDIDPTDPLIEAMMMQTRAAISEADMICLVLDGRSGVVPIEHEIASMLRASGVPLMVVVNKVEAEDTTNYIADAYSLGLDHVYAVSAEHNLGFDLLYTAMGELLGPDAHVEEEVFEEKSEDDEYWFREEGEEDIEGDAAKAYDEAHAFDNAWLSRPMRVAIVGRPNAGKSSLINRFAREDRVTANALPGTTRDAVDVPIDFHGEEILLIDTAGIRRQRSVYSKLEQLTVMQAFRSIDRADVVIVLLDGTELPSDQDARIVGMAHEKGKGIVLVSNKWDLKKGEENGFKEYEEVFRRVIPFVAYAPLLRISAATGKGVDNILKVARQVHEARNKRLTTGDLNRFMREIIEHTPPPVHKSKRPKIFFVSQPMTAPPTFVFSTNRPKDIHFSYRRFLANSLREHYGFEGTPLWLKFRERKSKSF